jgi:hypothetical protein
MFNENKILTGKEHPNNKSWGNVVSMYKKKTNNLVSVEDSYEIKIIVEIVKKEFSFLTEKEIGEAIALCCMQIVPPRRFDIFMECLRKTLNLI